MHLGADCDLPWTSKEPVGNPPSSWFGSFQQQIQVTSISLEAACTYIWHPRFYSCHLRDSTPDCLALIANVACIHESCKTVLDKEVIVNGHTRKPWLQLSPAQDSAQREQTKNAHLSFFSWKGFDCILSQVMPEHRASNQPASR